MNASYSGHTSCSSIFVDGSTIMYAYTADGARLRSKHSGGITRDWCGEAMYEGSVRKMILNEEGYIDCTASNALRFYVKDHLGSVRAVLNSSGTVLESCDYYPLGGQFNASSGQVQPYKFSGKELDTYKNINTLDFGARTYDPSIGRWLTQDPLAEKYYNLSPYNYCAGNPVRYVDPDGMAWDDPSSVEQLRKSINRRIERLEKKIERLSSKNQNQGLTERISDYKSQISFLNTSLNDIELLYNDDNHLYSLVSPIDNNGMHGVKSVDGYNVSIETSLDALSFHEISHVRQSLSNGGLIFKNGSLMNAGTVSGSNKYERAEAISNNEVEAYQIQYSMDNTFPGTLNDTGVKGINIHSVGSIMYSGTKTPVYKVIKDFSDYVKLLTTIKQ